jgi:hypothetical protein
VGVGGGALCCDRNFWSQLLSANMEFLPYKQFITKSIRVNSVVADVVFYPVRGYVK